MAAGDARRGEREATLMTTRDQITYCRICEALCGLVVTTSDGRIVRVRADRENPASRGFMCAKGAAMADVQADPDRVRAPLRRCGDVGEFEAVTWDEALDDIAQRVSMLLDTHGPDAFGMVLGNPQSFSSTTAMWARRFLRTIGSDRMFSVNSEDGAAHQAACFLLYGIAMPMPLPDVWHTEFLLIVGANPWVSKGSILTEPRLRDALSGIIDRGGRVVVVDPRRTETAERFEHVGIRAGTDGFFLLSVLHTLFGEGLVDSDFLARCTVGTDELRDFLGPYSPEDTEHRTGIPAHVVRDIARGFGSAQRAVIYGRTGTCTQKYGTAVNVAQELVNVVTGNLDRQGGALFGASPLATDDELKAIGRKGFGQKRTRVAGLPDAHGFLPSNALADEIGAGGSDSMRALFTVASNLILSSPDGARLGAAMDGLDLHVAIDLYVTETAAHADYILPCTTFLERSDVEVNFAMMRLRPFIQATSEIVERAGDVREEWEIFEELALRIWGETLTPAAAVRELEEAGMPLGPHSINELRLRRTGYAASTQGFLEIHPSGRLIDLDLAGRLEGLIAHADGRIPLLPAEVRREFERMQADAGPPGYDLRLIGLREQRSHNSWMHNVSSLMPDGRHMSLRIHPDDAYERGIGDGDTVAIESETGVISVEATLTSQMTPGNVALPHGWGHRGGWRRANAAGGACSNALASSRPQDLERLAAMTVLNGIPVRVARVAGTGEDSPT
jgi:formate dehydrogenase